MRRVEVESMATVTTLPHRATPRQVTPPRWPVWQLVAFASLAAISLAQGIVDVVVPAITGEAPFGFLMAATERFGPLFLGLYIFVHNLGLACMVPGAGFVAAWYEKHTVNRGRIGLLLAGAVVVSLLVALQYLLSAHDRFVLAFALPLFAAEALGVLILTVPAARELRGFVPTPAYGWSLLLPFRRLRRPFLASAVLLAALALVESVAMIA